MKPSSPPPRAVTFLRWAVGLEESEEDILGDLFEEFAQRSESDGPRAASRWFWRECIRIGVVFRLKGGGVRRDAKRFHEGQSWRRLSLERSVAGLSWLDFKLGFRMLARYPVLSTVSVLPTAIAVAAAVGTHSVSANLLHPRLPLVEGDRIVSLELWNVATRSSEPRALYDFARWRGQLRSIEHLGAFETYRPNLVDDEGRSEPVYGSKITASGFRVARVPPLLGRTLSEEDERPGGPDVVVLGYDLWHRWFGGDPAIVGESVQLGGSSPVVVGVMPKDFRFPFNDEVWVPLRYEGQAQGPLEGPAVFIFGRLRDGFDRRGAQAELDVVGRAAAVEFPDSHGLLRPQISPYGANLWAGPTLVFAGMQLALVLLMIIICSTVGALVFVRNLSRESEVAMRLALGASRRRIVTQLFTESMVMASAASALGVVLAMLGLNWVYGMVESSRVADGGLPFWFHGGLAQGTVYYVLALTLLSAGLTGLLPALSMTGRRSRLLRRISSDRASFRVSTGATAAIAGQSALTIALLALVSGLWPGIVGEGEAGEAIDGSRYLTAELRPGGEVPRTREERFIIYDRLLETSNELGLRLRATPGVTGVTFASALPGTRQREYRVEIEGRDQRRNTRSAPSAWVDFRFFEVLGVPLLAGRTFEPHDFEDAASTRAVAIVNRSFANEWFGDENPIGKRLRVVGSNHADDPLSEIVGLVGDIGMSLSNRARPSGVYFPLRTGTYPLRVAVQLRSRPDRFASSLRAISSEVDPRLRVGSVLMLDTLLDGARARQRAVYLSALLATLSVLALSLCTIYAVMSFLVARRTREIGIRRALGGRANQIVMDVLGQSMAKIGVGVAIGIALMWLLRLMTMASVSWGALIAVSFATLGSGLLACIGPAIRAASVHPLEAIRLER